ncbi:MAG TPA: hypothetical protein VF172_03095 [Nitrososphaera sp.]|jgi:hypothetical protein
MDDIDKKIEENTSKLKDLLMLLVSAPLHNIADVKKNRKAYNFPGVYAIRTPDGKEIIYVGRTKEDKGIGNRMNDHLSVTSRQPEKSSDLCMMIKVHKEYPQDKDSYKVQYVRIDDVRERGLFEDFAIAVLRPPFNKFRCVPFINAFMDLARKYGQNLDLPVGVGQQVRAIHLSSGTKTCFIIYHRKNR